MLVLGVTKKSLWGNTRRKVTSDQELKRLTEMAEEKVTSDENLSRLNKMTEVIE